MRLVLCFRNALAPWLRESYDSGLRDDQSASGNQSGMELAMAKKSDSDDQTLTTRQGRPVTNNESQRTVGSRGPATLENYHFLEKISHFDRERIPERVVHARGFVAHGEFEAYGTVGGEPASTYTRAKLFQERGRKTPVTI